MSGLSRKLHDRLARRLLEAEINAEAIEPLTAEHPDLDLEDAYAIQLRGRELRRAQDARIIGHKVGLTSAAMQQMLGVDQPDFGYLTLDMVSHSGGRLPCSKLIGPRVEVEIAFRLEQPLRGAGLSREKVLAATAEVAPALEVIDSRVADWRIGIADTIADNASCGRVVLGEFLPLGDLDLAAVEAEMSVNHADGAPPERVEGRGEAVLGHPAEAIVWLARALDEFGEGLEPGELILPGAMAKAVPVRAGDTVQATLTDLGAVTITMDVTMDERS